jgi:DNA-binding response OmpR family regulator
LSDTFDKLVGDGSDVHPRSILVYDRDVASLNFIAMALRRHGYEALCAASLEEARALLQVTPATLTICYFRAGDADGPAVLAASKRHAGVRAVAVTTAGIKARGADRSFVGPIPIVLLIRAVDQLARGDLPIAERKATSRGGR